MAKRGLLMAGGAVQGLTIPLHLSGRRLGPGPNCDRRNSILCGSPRREFCKPLLVPQLTARIATRVFVSAHHPTTSRPI